ncbi:amidohydrolase family protein [Chloroflexota bacterium]
MKIDVFCHIMPPKFMEVLKQRVPSASREISRIASRPTMYDLDARFRLMDKYGEMVQVVTLTNSVTDMLPAGDSVELAKLANDELAELTVKYPDRIVGAVATLPMNDLDAALEETDRAIRDLKLRGVQIDASPNGEPLDMPKFIPLFEKMSQYNLPIWIHPQTVRAAPELPEAVVDISTLTITFQWPYQTTMAMARLVYAGVFERYPNLKVITHHCGAMVPFFAERIAYVYDNSQTTIGVRDRVYLSTHPIEYFRSFYTDTALNGWAPGLMCGYQFFGPDHLLFATDFPHGPQFGDRFLRNTIRSVEEMDIPEADRRKIFADNAKKLLRLGI